ncbi:protein of unknown function [Paenibacillaceae bacterium GAS479]|nr:protein of unknown function [Paenibacillaceae bacterium GAS479]
MEPLIAPTILMIVSILSLSHWILRKWVFRIEKEELSRRGKKVNFWGITLILLASIYIIFSDTYENYDLKSFWMLFVLISKGFHSFIDWKYREGSKEYIVTLLVLVIGEVLVYFLL